MVCPVCGGAISPDANFCGRCGAKIPRCPTCGKVIEKRMNFCLNDGTRLSEEILSVFLPVEKPQKLYYRPGAMRQPVSAFQQEGANAVGQSVSAFQQDGADAVGQSVSTFQQEGADTATQPVGIAPYATGEGFPSKTAPIAITNYPGTGIDTNFTMPEYTPVGYTEATVSGVCRVCGRPCQPKVGLCTDCQDRIIEQKWKEGQDNKKPVQKKRRSRILPIMIILFLMFALVGSVAGYLVFSGGLSSLKVGGTDGQVFEESEPSYGSVAAVEYSNGESGEAEADEGVTVPDEPEVDGGATVSREPEVDGGATVPEEPEIDEPALPEEPESGTAMLPESTGVTPTPEPVRSVSERVEDFIDHCAERVFQRRELAGFDKDNYTLAINAIYAHAGRRFKESDERLRTYFGAKSWYYPTIDGEELYERLLNEYQVQNLYLLLSYGIDQGFRKASTADGQLSAFISGCTSRYFTVSNLSELDDDMAYLARNAIYARSGWDFESGYLRGFFSRFDWYHPTTLPPSFSDDMLNTYQKYNRDIVNEYILSKGYSSITGETARYEQALFYA